jgi:hypothetical protein
VIRAELSTHERFCGAKSARHIREYRLFKEAAGTFILRKEYLDLPPQLAVFAAGLIEKRLASFGRPFQRSVEEFLGFPPKILLHKEPLHSGNS